MSKKIRALSQYVIEGIEPIYYHVTIESFEEENKKIVLKVEYNADDYENDDIMMKPLFNYMARMYNWDGDKPTKNESCPSAQITLILIEGKPYEYRMSRDPSLWHASEKLTLERCWPIAINFGELSYSSVPIVEIEITWIYEELKRESPPKEILTKEIWEKYHFGL